jgi:hypothetical protein
MTTLMDVIEVTIQRGLVTVSNGVYSYKDNSWSSKEEIVTALEADEVLRNKFLNDAVVYFT